MIILAIARRVIVDTQQASPYIIVKKIKEIEMSVENPLGLRGIEFVEFTSPNPETLHNLFLEFGFSKIGKHKSKDVDYYRQNDIHFFINKEDGSFGKSFANLHGPSICSMGWRMDDALLACSTAIERGAKIGTPDYQRNNKEIPSIFGIGDSLIYFIDDFENPKRYEEMGFEYLDNPILSENKGFIAIDHLTNNVYPGEMAKWTEFYKSIFGFTEVRYFDIRGAKTGLTSFALQAPGRSFCIPINEGTETKSQINEYLDEYKGPGVQHLAFITHDIVKSVASLSETSISTLDIDEEYYSEVFDRVPNVTENYKDLQKHDILVDGDEAGYLLQIFTKNIIGPIFIEIIQRKNHFSFGEGNFGALFRSIERDQEKRGYL
jgi:4-hydroxyphenylpyruvate dioxygenase